MKRRTEEKTAYGVILLGLLLLILSGCYTQLRLSDQHRQSKVEHYYSQRCYYQKDYMHTEFGVMETYRRVCPNDFDYRERRWRSSFYYQHHYERDYTYFDEPVPVPAERTYRPRGSTIGRSSSEDDERGRRENRAERRDRDRDRTERTRTRRDTSGRR